MNYIAILSLILLGLSIIISAKGGRGEPLTVTQSYIMGGLLTLFGVVFLYRISRPLITSITNYYDQNLKQLEYLGSHLMALLFTAGFLHLGLSVWETRSVRFKELVFDAGAYAQPIGFLIIGLGCLILYEVLNGLGFKIKSFLYLLMFSFAGSLFIAFGVSMALAVLNFSEGINHALFPRIAISLILLGSGLYITFTVMQEFYRMWAK